MSDLPVMAPAYGIRLPPGDPRWGCWARCDNAPPFASDTGERPYSKACGASPAATDLGLCAYHEAQLFPPEARRGPA